MQEDQSRIRIKNAAENFAVLRRIALNLLKKAPHKRKKISMALKGKICSWDRDYLLKVLFPGEEILPSPDAESGDGQSLRRKTGPRVNESVDGGTQVIGQI